MRQTIGLKNLASSENQKVSSHLARAHYLKANILISMQAKIEEVEKAIIDGFSLDPKYVPKGIYLNHPIINNIYNEVRNRNEKKASMSNVFRALKDAVRLYITCLSGC